MDEAAAAKASGLNPSRLDPFARSNPPTTTQPSSAAGDHEQLPAAESTASSAPPGAVLYLAKLPRSSTAGEPFGQGFTDLPRAPSSRRPISPFGATNLDFNPQRPEDTPALNHSPWCLDVRLREMEIRAAHQPRSAPHIAPLFFCEGFVKSPSFLIAGLTK